MIGDARPLPSFLTALSDGGATTRMCEIQLELPNEISAGRAVRDDSLQPLLSGVLVYGCF